MGACSSIIYGSSQQQKITKYWTQQKDKNFQVELNVSQNEMNETMHQIQEILNNLPDEENNKSDIQNIQGKPEQQNQDPKLKTLDTNKHHSASSSLSDALAFAIKNKVLTKQSQIITTTDASAKLTEQIACNNSKNQRRNQNYSIVGVSCMEILPQQNKSSQKETAKSKVTMQIKSSEKQKSTVTTKPQENQKVAIGIQTVQILKQNSTIGVQTRPADQFESVTAATITPLVKQQKIISSPILKIDSLLPDQTMKQNTTKPIDKQLTAVNVQSENVSKESKDLRQVIPEYFKNEIQKQISLDQQILDEQIIAEKCRESINSLISQQEKIIQSLQTPTPTQKEQAAIPRKQKKTHQQILKKTEKIDLGAKDYLDDQLIKPPHTLHHTRNSNQSKETVQLLRSQASRSKLESPYVQKLPEPQFMPNKQNYSTMSSSVDKLNYTLKKLVKTSSFVNKRQSLTDFKLVALQQVKSGNFVMVGGKHDEQSVYGEPKQRYSFNNISTKY